MWTMQFSTPGVLPSDHFFPRRFCSRGHREEVVVGVGDQVAGAFPSFDVAGRAGPGCAFHLGASLGGIPRTSNTTSQ